MLETYDRDGLIESMLPLVRHIVSRMGVFLPPYLSSDDLISAGVVGLIQAVDRYDPVRGASIRTFCAIRIRGAILDELRRVAGVPRSVFREARALAEVQEDLAQKLGREPTEIELARGMGMKQEQFESLLDRIRPASCFSLDEDAHDGDETHYLLNGDVLADPTALDASDTSLKEEELAIVKEQLDKLPQIQRQVLSLYYIEDLRLKEIAQVLGVTEGRVSQIHTLAISRLRRAIGRIRS